MSTRRRLATAQEKKDHSILTAEERLALRGLLAQPAWGLYEKHMRAMIAQQMESALVAIRSRDLASAQNAMGYVQALDDVMGLVDYLLEEEVPKERGGLVSWITNAFAQTEGERDG